jgi:phosphoglycerate dehydrogenase-like enzyme
MVLPGGDATYHLMDEERIQKMKKGAYLLNAGRGTAIEPAALEKALRDGHLGAAALDVTEPEPLPADSPLWDLDNLILTPHVAGNFFLPETVNRIVRIACENLDAWLEGNPMRNVTRHS